MGNFEQRRQEQLDKNRQDALLFLGSKRTRAIFAEELEKWRKENRGVYRTRLEKIAEVCERTISRLRSEGEGNT